MPELNQTTMTMRFKDATWFDKLPSLTIVGAGGIGSWTSILLGRAGCPKILVCDMDVYEPHNLGGQLSTVDSMYKNKAEELKSLMSLLGCTSEVTSVGSKYSKAYAKDVMIAAVDNMAARKQMFEDWKARPNRSLFLDGRLLAEHFQILCVVPGKEELYEQYLFDDAEIEAEACSYKQTSHAAAAIGSYITSFLINHVANGVEGVNVYNVPFYSEYVMPIGYINIDKHGTNNSNEGT